MKKLLALSFASLMLAATPAFAIHNSWDTPPPTQGSSTNDCNLNPGCLETSQPKSQVNKSGNNSPNNLPCRPMQVTNLLEGSDPLPFFLI